MGIGVPTSWVNIPWGVFQIPHLGEREVLFGSRLKPMFWRITKNNKHTSTHMTRRKKRHFVCQPTHILQINSFSSKPQGPVVSDSLSPSSYETLARAATEREPSFGLYTEQTEHIIHRRHIFINKYRSGCSRAQTCSAAGRNDPTGLVPLLNGLGPNTVWQSPAILSLT